jgi:predicted phage tail protein
MAFSLFSTKDIRQIRESQAAILHEVRQLRSIMATTFADVQSSITQIVNDNTAQNNAVAAQLKEVQRLMIDFQARAAQGNGPTAEEFQSAVQQLQSVHQLVTQNTAAIQSSADAITQADPSQNLTTQQPVTTTTTSSGVGEGAQSLKS